MDLLSLSNPLEVVHEINVGSCLWTKEQLLSIINPLKGELNAEHDICAHCHSFIGLHNSASIPSALLPQYDLGARITNDDTTQITPAACRSPKHQCMHFKRKDRCKICGGSAICQHNRMKTECVLCRV
jgi:hypothetical protein